MWKKILIGLSALVLFVVGFGFWFFSLLDDGVDQNKLVATQYSDINYFSQAVTEKRGKILTVVTSTAVMGGSGKKTGYELTELARAYAVFTANGFEVDIASTKGGQSPVVIDRDDMGEFDYAFLNDRKAQDKVNNTFPVDALISADYQAVYFVGGKGAMFDFPDNVSIQKIVRELYQAGKVVGAVCHGPAALVNVRLDNGSALVADKRISGFTNAEEFFLIPDARDIFPFLLEDKLILQGADFSKGFTYLEKVSHDGNLLTGQNPWSVWALSEAMIQQLGFTPIERLKTAEENSVAILGLFEEYGLSKTIKLVKSEFNSKPVSSKLIAMHSIVAAMQWKIAKAIDLVLLLNAAK